MIGLRRKNIKEKTKFLINNLKLCSFMSLEEVKEYYKMIKTHKELKDEKFETFLNDQMPFVQAQKKKKDEIIYKPVKYPFELWNYYDKYN